MAQLPLITEADLVEQGASSDFLAQFRVRPIEVKCTTSGALGVATFAWRPYGATEWSADELSDAAAPWAWSVPEPAWAVVTFAAATYTSGNQWSIAASGVVTPAGGSPSTVTATRVRIVATTIDAVTSDAVTWMANNRVKPPVLSLGAGQRGWLAAIAIYRLKSRQGMTPSQAGQGDENLRARAIDAEENLKAIGRSDGRPPDLVDSSTNNLGTGIPLMPRSLSPRGFGNFS